MSVQPYLFFNGRCEEALEFYRSALGAEVEMLSRFKDAPEALVAKFLAQCANANWWTQTIAFTAVHRRTPGS